jgi:hypothetical protein
LAHHACEGVADRTVDGANENFWHGVGVLAFGGKYRRFACSENDICYVVSPRNGTCSETACYTSMHVDPAEFGLNIFNIKPEMKKTLARSENNFWEIQILEFYR